MLAKFSDQRDESGFTLIELLVVILIIGILSAIAIPAFMNQRKSAAEASVKADLKSAAVEMETVLTKTKTYPNSLPSTVKTSDGVTLTVKPTGGTSGTATPAGTIPVTFPFQAASGETVNALWQIRGDTIDYNRHHMGSGNFNYSGSYTFICNGVPKAGNTVTVGEWSGQGFNSWFSSRICWNGEVITGFTFTGKVSYGTGTTNWGPETTRTWTMPPAASNGTGAFCIDGTHAGETTNPWKYDSKNGGLQKGVCS